MGDFIAKFYSERLREEVKTVTRFWELVKESVILQGLVTVLLLSVACYLWATGQAVPEQLGDLLQLVVGFWLGSKVQNVVMRK